MTKELQLRGTQLDGKKKKILLAAGAAVLGIAGIVFLASLLLRVDMDHAREIALSAADGGEIVGQSVDREGFWNEYSFQISNNGTWYEVELDSFGQVTELESGWDQSWDYDRWDWD
ncbi:hypothetical protein [Pseudoflavonifractor capillosus]|uniref:hypothetical protein n=1 Tax=Pseudoflavonifractor capillosus TaxID=106588 RepID=UPI0019561E25|nr:hypothetical protein [Pseudoflavonifractor capillosus]MBM6681965.1 hypothetical protein [Pseudoflavonifractor capillosus]